MDSGSPPGSPSCGLTNRSSSFFKLIDTFALEIGELKKEMVQTAPALDKEPLETPGFDLHLLWTASRRGVRLDSKPDVCFSLKLVRRDISDSSSRMTLLRLRVCLQYLLCLCQLMSKLLWAGCFSLVCRLQPPRCRGSVGEWDSGYDSLRLRMSVLERLTQTHQVWLLLAVSEEEASGILLKQPPGVFLVRKVLQRKVLSVRLDKDQSQNPISHFNVRESQYSFSMEGSGISFADLFHLVAFYCVSRDILPFTLKLPEAISSAKTQKELEEVAQLGAGFWDSALCSQRRCSTPPCHRLSRTLSPQRTKRTAEVEESHQSAPPTLQPHTAPPAGFQDAAPPTGPLCFVTPLFLQTHSRDPDPPEKAAESPPLSSSRCATETDLDRTQLNSKSRSPPPRPPPPRSAPSRRPAPPPPGPPPAVSRTKSMPVAAKQQQPSGRRPAPPPPALGGRTSSSTKSTSSPNRPPPRPKQPDLEAHRCHIALDDETIAKALSRANLPTCQPPPVAEEPSQNLSGPDERGRQRFSDMSMSTSSSDSLEYSRSPGFSLDLAPGPPQHPAEDTSEDDEDAEEEEEEDYGVGMEADLESRLRPILKARRRRVGVSLGGSSFVLPRSLKGRFSKVGGMLSSLITPEKRAVKRIAELSRDKSSYFGSLVQDYISFVQENRSCHTSGMDFLQTVRQFMTQMKAYLRQSSELDPPLESLIPEDQIDRVLEKAMHKCVLKPLKSVIEVILHDFQVNSGALQQLRENLALARTKKPHELGVDGAVPPDSVAIEKIRQKFLNMRKMYSPDQKVSLLLRVCKLIYTIMQDNSGRMYGADDFLPMLTYVVAQCDMPQLDTEVQYMMELLDPTLLQGEGGYYLTSAYGAMALIKNFQEEQAAQVLSSEARNTLHQWHRRRTSQRSAPSVDDFQNFLRVALQEVGLGCTAKTLQVQPYTTAEEVCSLCAYKFKIPDPENYALFLITEETRQQLAADTHPQQIKAELHSRPLAHVFHFVYRRVDNLNLCIPAHVSNGNCLQME